MENVFEILKKGQTVEKLEICCLQFCSKFSFLATVLLFTTEKCFPLSDLIACWYTQYMVWHFIFAFHLIPISALFGWGFRNAFYYLGAWIVVFGFSWKWWDFCHKLYLNLEVSMGAKNFLRYSAMACFPNANELLHLWIASILWTA